jgi:uncharacterized repeat protein (TIGR03803 family)
MTWTFWRQAARNPALRTIYFAIVATLGLALGATAQADQIIYNFTGPGAGAWPNSSLIADSSGALYGTTQGNFVPGNSPLGINCAPPIHPPSPYCSGTVFKLTPPPTTGGAWGYAVLHTFVGGTTDGAGPMGGLVRDSSGALYGTTANGGAHDRGIVFKLTPPNWKLDILHSFTGGSDGGNPMAGLIFEPAGSLYGTASLGGAVSAQHENGCGTVFRLVPPNWKLSVLYEFTCGADGGYPQNAVTRDQSGVLFGCTQDFGNATSKGTVYQLRPTFTPFIFAEFTLYSFSGTDGWGCNSNLVIDPTGAIFGTSGAGSGGFGEIFKLTPPTLTVLHSFGQCQADGCTPSGLILEGGKLYGVAFSGGASGNGVVYKLTPPSWNYAAIHSFAGTPDGAGPLGLAFAAGTLMGVTQSGGNNTASVDCAVGCRTVSWGSAYFQPP